MLSILNYQISETLYQGRYFSIYRGINQGTQQQTVIIKVPSTKFPSTAQIDKLRREFEIRERITSEHVVKYLELKPDVTYGYLLIEEDDQADTLIDHIPKIGFTSLAFLNIAIQLAEGLRDIHHSHVIHKDITPRNIIYQPNRGKVKYIDFNNAALLHQTIEMLALTTEGNLAYISPEQTGRINRRIDYRTDFYSLGVTFYQLLCGCLPFEVKQMSEIVYCHLAKKPRAPREVKPEIPLSLSEIIMKLLQKNAEARYQSAHGLLTDLKRCLEELTQKGEIAPFILAEHDISEYFYIPQKLYGRKSEISLLTQTYNRASQGQAEVVMIASPAGTGKSVLVREMQPTITAKRGWFLMGKFEFLNRNMAYSAITQAFQTWINQVLASSEEEIFIWKTQLLKTLGNQGQLLIDVMPNLELIIGKQPPVPNLDPEQTKNRFHLVFQNFIKCIAQPQHPIVLFLDDLQWAEKSSLQLLESLITVETNYLLCIGAYRDNEVESTHPLMQTLKMIRQANVPIHTITLSALALKSVNHWISDAVQTSSRMSTLHLSTLIYRKTEGLPFFIKVFLQTLYEQDLLTLAEDHWQWDLEKIRKLPATENVITFMIQQIQKLPPATQSTLQFASCMYHRFTLSTLQLITQKSSEQLLTELQPLLENGLLLQIDDYVQFAHDRIREAIYQQISEEKRATTHLLIGRLLQAHLPTQPTLEQESKMIEHLNQGKVLMTDLHEQLALAKLNLEIAYKAKAVAAYATALNYLQAGESYFTAIGSDLIWQKHYALAYDLYKALAEIEYLNGHFDASANYIDFVLNHAQTVLEKVDIYSLLIIQKTIMAHYPEALAAGYQALRLLGIDLQSKDLQALLKVELNQAKERLKNKTKQELLEAPLMTNANTKAIIQVLYQLAIPIHFLDPNFTALINTMIVNLTLQHGNTKESALGYSLYGALLIFKFNEIQRGHELGALGIQLSDKFHDLTSQCRTNIWYTALIHYWRKPLRQMEFYLNRAQQAGLEAGDFQFLGYHSHVKVLYLFYRGVSLNAIEIELNKHLRLPYVRANQLTKGLIHAVRLVIFNLKGQTSKETVFQDEVKNEIDYQTDWQEENNLHVLAHYLVLKLQVLYLYGQFEKALEVLALLKPHLDFILRSLPAVSYNFYHSLVLTALYPMVEKQIQQQYWQQLEANQVQMKIWADNCPENFLHKYLLVAAEMARLVNNGWEAEGKYDQAIHAAKNNEFIQEQALACELTAKFWLAQNRPRYAQGLLQDAYQFYERWGAKHKIDQFMLQYPEFLKPLAITHLSNFNVSGEETTSVLRLLDLTSILKISQAISSEIDLSKLLVKIMNLLIENAGAQKGAFLLEESGTLFVQAEYTLEGQVHTLQKLPLSQWKEGAHSIIEYVKRTQQPVLLGNASQDKQYDQDLYISTHHIQSVLCVPVIRNHQLKGILYVENNLAPYVFTKQHLQILTILSSQIAISLENAVFYESTRAITEQLNLALQSGNVGTWSWAIQTDKIIWDEYMYELFGRKKENFDHTYAGFMTLIHPEDVALVEQAVKQTVKENKPFNIEYRIVKPDNSIHVMSARGKIYCDDNNQPERMIGIVWDITERKRLEQERLQALTQAEEKERQRAEEAEKHRKNMEEFMNLVSHEIRNPLAGIYGNIDLLLQTAVSLKLFIDTLSVEAQPKFYELLYKLEESIQQIQQCAKHQKAIIDDVLDLSKLESGKITFTVQPFRLKSIIEEVAKIFVAPMALKKLSLILDLPESEPWIKGDANHLKMILINLVTNALKFTQQGHIKIQLKLLEVTSSKTTFILQVEDTGAGMSAEEMSRLFQRFAQATDAQYEGSGLGLFISKKFIEYLGGQIDVKSQKGAGSQFTIQFTCETAQAEDKLVSSAVIKESSFPICSEPKHILVVEDNVINQKIICNLLKQAKHTYEVAVNGLEAVNKWKQSHFHLILMDVAMPEMDGFDATRAIRKEEQRSKLTYRTPIVCLSAFKTEEYVNKSKEVGMDDYITKPFTADKIYNTIKQWAALSSKPSLSQHKQIEEKLLPKNDNKPKEIDKLFGENDPGCNEEIACKIFKYISPRTLLWSVPLVSKRWHKIARHIALEPNLIEAAKSLGLNYPISVSVKNDNKNENTPLIFSKVNKHHLNMNEIPIPLEHNYTTFDETTALEIATAASLVTHEKVQGAFSNDSERKVALERFQKELHEEVEIKKIKNSPNLT